MRKRRTHDDQFKARVALEAINEIRKKQKENRNTYEEANKSRTIIFNISVLAHRIY